MRKHALFGLSMILAFGIAFYIKRQDSHQLAQKTIEWKTFVKRSNQKIVSHHTTNEEFDAAKISNPNEKRGSRSPSSVDPFKGFMVRNNRILMGELDKKYEDENTDLQMVNKVNPNWKEIMGNDLIRFQPEDTRVMVKEEIPVIKIEDGKGRFLEQVIVTYLLKNGDKNSFKALVDSGSGMIVEMWDRTIHEKVKKRRAGLTLPSVNESGIITK